MKLRVFLFPVLVPLWLLGFLMTQLGENRRSVVHSKSTELNFVVSVEDLNHATEEQQK
jgi:hypothetical protein